LIEMPLWKELNRTRFEKARSETNVAIMVTGAVEAHGTHLPLGTDCILPEYLAEAVAAKTKALVLPSIPFGDSWSFNPFMGTISIDPHALVEYYISVMKGVFKNGITYLIVLNGHGGNSSHIQTAAKEATKSGERVVVLVNWWVDLAVEAREIALETPEGHAAEDETSEVLHVAPHLVDLEKATSARVKTKYRIIAAQYRKELLPEAMYGEPSKATPEKGKLIMEQAEEDLVALIERLEHGELPIEHN
jgi:creatinine amidohydrolase